MQDDWVWLAHGVVLADMLMLNGDAVVWRGVVLCGFSILGWSLVSGAKLRVLRLFALALATLGASGCEPTGGPAIGEWGAETQPPDLDQRGGGGVERRGGANGVALLGSRGGPAQIVEGTGRLIGTGRTRRFGVDARGDDGVTLNVVNLPIAQAAKIVLGDTLGVDYVVDPKLDSKVTVHTARPVRREAALELFQSSLHVAGAALVDSGGVYKIVPQDQATTSGMAVSSGRADSGLLSEQIGESARVVQLRYVSAGEMKRLLEPITQRGGIVRADEARNALTLTGTAQEIATLQDTISMFDVDTMRGMSFALVPVKSSDPDALVEDLRNVFASERDGPMNGQIRFIGNKRLAAILAISAQPQYLARARAWIQRLDARAQGSEKQFYSYRVQNRPAKELVQVLASMFGPDASGSGTNVAPRFGQSNLSSGGSASGAPGGQLGAISPAGSGSGAFGGSGGGLGSGSGIGGVGGGLGSAGGAGGSPGIGAGGPNLFGGTNAAGSGSGSASSGPQSVALGENSRFKLAVDEAKNAIVVMASPDDYKRLLRVIETLDVLPNQVFIEATIAEVSLNDEMQFGVRWFLQKKSSSAGFSSGQTGTPSAVTDILGNNLLGAPVSAIFPGFAYAFRGANAQATLNALNTVTNVNVISTPSLTVLDNRQAVLQIGDQVAVQTFSGTNLAASGNSAFNGTTYRDTGVILAITPHINESGRVMLELEQEVSNVAPGQAASLTPTIQQRKVKTQVVVNDSESLMLGGLIQDQRTRSADQVPIMGDIPIFGNAFKDKDDTITKTELLILITPHVVRSLDEAREITDEYKRKLLSIATKAKSRPHDIEQSTRRVLLDEWSTSGSRADRLSR